MEKCSQVMAEPELQPVPQLDTPSSPNIHEGARPDITMNSFWSGRSDRSFEDKLFLTLLQLLMSIPKLSRHKTSTNMHVLDVIMRWSMPPSLPGYVCLLGIST